MKKARPKYLEQLKKFWHYLWYDDSLMSYVLNFALAFLFIKFIFFPSIGFALNNDYPVVAIVSGSMEHKFAPKTDSYGRSLLNKDGTYTYALCGETYKKEKKLFNFDKNVNLSEFWGECGNYYEKNFNISMEQFGEFKYKNGLNIGDVMILYGKDPKEIEIGDVLVFEPQSALFFETHGPVIHRVVRKWQDDSGDWHFRTKGDHNDQSFVNFENDIHEDKVIGVGSVRIPFIGYAKIALNRVMIGFSEMIR